MPSATLSRLSAPVSRRPPLWNVVPRLYQVSGADIRRAFPTLSRAEFLRLSLCYLRGYRRASRILSARFEKASEVYGRPGVYTSGGFYSEWPAEIQAEQRRASRLLCSYLDGASGAWKASGRRMETFRRETSKL